MKTIQNLILVIILGIGPISYSQKSSEVDIKTTQLSDHIYLLSTGKGGNVGLSVGDDGILVIDSEFAPSASKIEAAIREISNKPIRYLLNTHHHGDHTGGNLSMYKLGATIIGHDNIRTRLKLPNRDKTMNPKEALPVITFSDKLNLYMNGEQVSIFHVENANTDGDALIYFEKSNILVTGDTYVKDLYPYIDLRGGGTIDGSIAAIKKGLLLVDNNTKIIPGHRAVSNKAEYIAFLNMLETLKKKVLAEIALGKTEAEIVANTSITKYYDDLGFNKGIVSSELLRKIFYNGLK